MDNNSEKPTAYMQWVKSQTEVLIPLLRHLRAELGETAANDLVYPVLRDYMKNWVTGFASAESTNPIENFHTTSERLETLYKGDVDFDVLKQDDTAYESNVTGCRYADFFKQLGEPELGTILVCEADNHIADLAAPSVQFSRVDTLMKGGTHCPFRYRFSDEQTGD